MANDNEDRKGRKFVSYNYAGKILELARTGDKHALAEFVAKRAKQLNQRFYRLEKAEKGLGESAYRYAQYETGKEKPRYSQSASVYEKMDIADIVEVGYQINSKIASKTSSMLGLEEIAYDRLKNQLKSIKDIVADEVSDQEWIDFITYGGGEYLNSKYLDSTQIIDDWVEQRKKGVSTKQFLREFKRYKKKENIDFGKMRKAWQKIADKKRKKEE